jgi:ATPase subunit of ABC transporter with duplicated ATPase domains
MPAAITLHKVSASTPDGRPLFDHLDLSFGPVRTGLVGRNGVGKSTLLALIAGEAQPAHGSISIEGTIGVLRQIVQIAGSETVATVLGLADALDRLERLERGAGSLDDAAEADWTLPQRLEASLAELGLPMLDPTRAVLSLSGGQRTRLALAGLLLAAPDMILLDEPTNNLDADGRASVAAVLSRWRGGAIVVSHDRGLLDAMDAIVELTSLGATTYGGNYAVYRERKALELAAAERAADEAGQRLTEVDRRVQAQAERKARRDGVGRRKGREGGTPRILLGAMKRRAEATSGSQARLAGRMHEAAAADLAAAQGRIEVLQPVAVRLTPTGLPAGRRVLVAEGLGGGPEGAPDLIGAFDLAITGPERVAITGPNGSGKTSLLRLLTGALPAAGGTVHIGVPWALLDQAVSLLDPLETIRNNYRRLNPGEGENACRAALARFKFRADAALQQVETLSRGEMLRAALAATIGSERPAELLILDEPTNHLDLDAIAAVEAGLNGYDGALLVVSHDRAFLDAIRITGEIELPPTRG